MEGIIDTDNIDQNVRCQDVKVTVIYINLIGAPISFLALIISIIVMIRKKKKISFLTQIIIFIFFSEILNTISKMIQLFKYCFDDYRQESSNNSEVTARGVICQIQIFISIISDVCSLLGTLLLSIRCYYIMTNSKKLFNTKKKRYISLCLIVAVSIIFSLVILFIDRWMTEESITYKYDRRDRCSYWCWLWHDSSLICYSFYLIAVVFNIVYSCKSILYLRKGKKILLDQSLVFTSNNDEICLANNNDNKILSKKDEKKMEELRIMRLKCIIYPSITNSIWIISTIYRITDDIVMRQFDSKDEDNIESDKEKDYFNDNHELKVAVEIFLVFHTLLSSIRGLLYGLSFIIFEEKVFGNCFTKCFNFFCCSKLNDFEIEGNENKELLRDSATSLKEIKNDNDEIKNDGRSNASNYSSSNNDLNNSDYHYND